MLEAPALLHGVRLCTSNPRAVAGACEELAEQSDTASPLTGTLQCLERTGSIPRASRWMAIRAAGARPAGDPEFGGRYRVERLVALGSDESPPILWTLVAAPDAERLTTMALERFFVEGSEVARLQCSDLIDGIRSTLSKHYESSQLPGMASGFAFELGWFGTREAAASRLFKSFRWQPRLAEENAFAEVGHGITPYRALLGLAGWHPIVPGFHWWLDIDFRRSLVPHCATLAPGRLSLWALSILSQDRRSELSIPELSLLKCAASLATFVQLENPHAPHLHRSCGNLDHRKSAQPTDSRGVVGLLTHHDRNTQVRVRGWLADRRSSDPVDPHLRARQRTPRFARIV
jgi:hypothetical protein